MSNVLTDSNGNVYVNNGNALLANEPTLIIKSVTANGTYNASDDSADGYSSVSVNVPASSGVIWTTVDNDGYPLTVDARDLKDSFHAFDCENNTSTYARMTSVILNSNLTSIKEYAFRKCIGLTSITIPDGVTSIGASGFYYCTGLTSITIPDSVTSLGSECFSYCTGLTNLFIGRGLNSAYASAFLDCMSLASIEVDSNNSKYHSSGNCMIETLSKKIFAGSNTSIIPTDGSVEIIGQNSFRKRMGLTSISIPGSVKTIEIWAFSYCYNLLEIDCTALTVTNGNVDTALAGTNSFFDLKSNARFVFATEAIKNAYAAATNWSNFASRMTYVGA